MSKSMVILFFVFIITGFFCAWYSYVCYQDKDYIASVIYSACSGIHLASATYYAIIRSYSKMVKSQHEVIAKLFRINSNLLLDKTVDKDSSI